MCVLSLSEYTVQVQVIIAARCNTYCSALMKLGFSFTLTGQCDFPWWMFTVARYCAYARCNKLLHRAAIMLMQRFGILSLWHLTFWSIHLCLTCVWKISSECAILTLLDAIILMQRDAIIIAALWNFGLGWLSWTDFDLNRLWNHLESIRKFCHAAIIIATPVH